MWKAVLWSKGSLQFVVHTVLCDSGVLQLYVSKQRGRDTCFGSSANTIWHGALGGPAGRLGIAELLNGQASVLHVTIRMED